MARTEMLIGGRWRPASGSGPSEDVTSPYDGSVVGTVPVAGADDVEAALHAAEHGARTRRHPGRRAGQRPAGAQDLLHRLDRHRRAEGWAFVGIGSDTSLLAAAVAGELAWARPSTP